MTRPPVMARLAAMALLLLAASGHAEIYQWTDAEGVIHFGDRPPSGASAKHITVEINSYQSVTVEPFEAFQSERPGNSHGVVMYSTSWCGFCKRARAYFRRQGIAYQEYDVENSAKGRRDYKKLNGHGVPIILVGRQRMNGFSVGRFQRLYQALKK
jgi:glutaredoxin